MDKQNFIVRKAAVLGAGVMGAQIAAHLVNANIETLLFELPANSANPNESVIQAVEKLKKQEPAPLSIQAKSIHIQPANYDQHLNLLQDCDLVIEAIAERTDWKADLYTKVSPHLGNNAIFASNTSGLSINQLAQTLPIHLRSRFCGVHFFNPPRYMHLVELIPCAETNVTILDELETFLVTNLGKGIIRAKDTPNFIANRVGIFSLLATMHHSEKFGLGFDLVDALTGALINRPKSATFRTADIVGLDTLAHVIRTMHETLSDDPWHAYFAEPNWLKELISKGALGQKTKQGVYQKIDKEIHVLDLSTQKYRLSTNQVNDDVKQLLKHRNAAEKFAALRANPHPQAQFIWSIYRDLFHYCAVHLHTIANNARDVDLAIRWGFGWEQGPFEIWQDAGWEKITTWINEDIAASKSMSHTLLPDWVSTIENNGSPHALHSTQGSYSPLTQKNQARSTLPVYQRQLFPDHLIGENVEYGETIFENEVVRMWHTGDRIAIISFKTKMHTISIDVLNSIQYAIQEAEQHWRALIIWQTEPPFSAGANLQKATERPRKSTSTFNQVFKKIKKTAQSTVLKAARELDLADKLMAGKLAEVETMVTQFQVTSQQLRYCMIPTVAAVDGLALGGGCEFMMHCDRTVASLESYIGLVEAGVGLLPAGGGCKEFTLRSTQQAIDGDPFPLLKNYFQTVAMAQLAKSSEQAKEMGHLKASDQIIMNRFELLNAAKLQIHTIENGYRPPLKAKNIPVCGTTGIATIKSLLVNMYEGAFISEHDYLIANKIAHVMCGGNVTPGSLVDEEWLLKLERTAFMELLATEKTQQRIEHTLKTGKPLRN